MAPHHHLRASFLANPGLFSFPPTGAAPVVHSARTALSREPSTSRVSPRPPVQTKSSLSTYASTDTTSGILHPIVQRIADPIKANVTEPFWRGLKDGTIEARNRERTQREGKTMTTSEKKRALVFAGLGSYPHQPSSPTDASLHLWERASEALLTPCDKIGYVPRTIDEEKGAMRGSLGDGMDPGLWRRWNKGWLRGWVGNRSINELMSRPDIKAAYVITSNLAILASAQSHAPAPIQNDHVRLAFPGETVCPSVREERTPLERLSELENGASHDGRVVGASMREDVSTCSA